MSDNKNAINLLQAQYAQMRDWLFGTMKGVDKDLVHQQPAGKPAPIGAQAGHAISVLDGLMLGGVRGAAPLMMAEYADKTGLSIPHSGPLSEWGAKVEVDTEALHAYAAAVFAGIDELLSGMTDDELSREVDFGEPAGTQRVDWAFNIGLLNTYSHVGEISALKGMKGLQGYPF